MARTLIKVRLIIILVAQECLVDFCNVEHWTCNVGGYFYLCQTPSPHGASRTSTVFSIWSTTGFSMFTFELTIVWFTWGWEKFTCSCLCESPFDLRARFTFCLQKPNISSPSICVILNVQSKLKEYFKIASTSYFKSSDWITLCKSSSLLSSHRPSQPFCLNENIMLIVWKFEHNHPMS